MLSANFGSELAFFRSLFSPGGMRYSNFTRILDFFRSPFRPRVTVPAMTTIAALP